MNFLAHLYLAAPSCESRLGNLMADFVKGAPDPRLTPTIIAGIRQHRAIDQFTDHHAIVRLSKHTISTERRRFAGIIVDVCYDHFLHQHWQTYSSRNLQTFIREIYTQLPGYEGYLPQRVRGAIAAMIDHDWLNSCQTVAGVGLVLSRIARRLKHPNPLAGAEAELERNYAALDSHFRQFFPEAIAYAHQCKVTTQA
ncbi:MAG: ACP phosphodiesterase [Synechococcales bacterium]|nr:ACP phosphodiesterase [Synechococcales bacterium]